MKGLDFLLRQELGGLRRHGLFREMKRIDSAQGPVVNIDGREVILLSSNNYLGLATHPEVIKAQIDALREFGTGSCASRLISGNMNLHEELERRIAAFKHEESAIVFSTGYMANLGTISSLVGEGDLVICDKLNHASIIDGVRLSRARLRTYPHKNLRKLKDILEKEKWYKKKLIITDGVFSMDGDIAFIPDLVKLSTEFNAILMVDDAHATGVLGQTGRGTCEHFNVKTGVDIQMGTLSKAFGLLGGYITGSSSLTEYIRNRARSFIYTTGLPPTIAAGCIKAIEIAEKGEDLRKRLWRNATKMRRALKELGFDTMESETQIIPVLTGDVSNTMRTAERLFEMGVFAPGVRPPTVPKNKCRIRVSIMATHKDAHIDKVIDSFRRLKDEPRYKS
ncbi:MAG: 8-amino-7-oxononanoate synthase [Candidatus Omnitrophica bacterium]|nr:8-amino-7-oxononanoate synthase [Candidatus Omnitrophota bacterium]